LRKKDKKTKKKNRKEIGLKKTDKEGKGTHRDNKATGKDK
jgi:hypothetical protein